MSSQPLAPRRSIIGTFIGSAASGGIVLMLAVGLALIVANSPFGPLYVQALSAKLVGLSTQHWINDGLMAMFFLLVGLEIKRELVSGQLSTWPRRILPGSAALGGMIVPAIVFLAFNAGDAGHPTGWAIPAATDIAFALGVLSLLGPHVPLSLKVFLTALAIIDDLGAVLVIALFYTGSVDLPALGGATAAAVALVALNRLRVQRLAPYLLLGVVLWALVLHSGIHPTLAGIVLAFAIPVGGDNGTIGGGMGPLQRLEHWLQPWVAFLVVPLFGFANAGLSFAGLSLAQLADPLPLGVAAGLFLGKQAGVMAAAALVIRAGWAEMPAGASWRQLYGVALLCGIGFTMSLFIGLLAFSDAPLLQAEVRIGVLCGSLLSAMCGTAMLRTARRVNANAQNLERHSDDADLSQ